MPTQTQPPGTLPLFKFKGIQVSIHWSWFLALAILYQYFDPAAGIGAFLATYLSLFGIVLIHEFGHALACRSVGGQAENIILWPLGGVAFVNPPPRPGAVLWSIAAGPLVNVVLLPVTFGLLILVNTQLPGDRFAGLRHYALLVADINLVLLIFNIMPIYPLDGGQILQSILWFFMARSKSLRIAATIGVVMAVVIGVLSLMVMDVWMVLMAGFIFWQAWRGLKIARFLAMHGQ